jgi:hypothetical protein
MIDVALERVPDEPGWVDTRGMLLSGRAQVAFSQEPEAAADGFVVWVPDAALMSIVGRPPASLIVEIAGSLDGDVNALCQFADAAHVGSALPQWQRTVAVLHTLRSRASCPESCRTAICLPRSSPRRSRPRSRKACPSPSAIPSSARSGGGMCPSKRFRNTAATATPSGPFGR